MQTCGMIAFRAALVSVVVLCTSAETPGEFSDTSTMLQKMEIMKSPKKNEKRQPEPEPHIIGLRLRAPLSPGHCMSRRWSPASLSRPPSRTLPHPD